MSEKFDFDHTVGRAIGPITHRQRRRPRTVSQTVNYLK